MLLNDALGRPMRDLRLSVTDRCNFRCPYCMPKEVFGRDFAFLPRASLLTFEEMARLAGIFASFGVEKIRLTGGEPLLRKDLPQLVAMLHGVSGVSDLAMTTNGSLLTRELARALKAAGLHRISISLDAVDDDVFRRTNDVNWGVDRVLQAIDAAAEAGLVPVKIDVVLRRGLNEDQILPIADRFRGTPHVVRFIEYMDVGTTNGWRIDDVVPGAEVLRTIGGQWPLQPLEPNAFGEVAQRWRYADGAGEIGIITSVTRPFCSSCTRARLSSDGRFYLCLFAADGLDLRTPLRDGASDDELARLIATAWRGRTDRYSDLRTSATADLARVEMSRIGG